MGPLSTATYWDFPRSSSFFFSMKYARISLARWRWYSMVTALQLHERMT